MTVRESPDELTLRAEEVGTWKSYIIVDHVTQERWGPPQVDADWHAFCQALYKEDWGEPYDASKAMSRAVGVKKPQEAQKAKALRKMKAAKDAGEEYHDPTREDNIFGETRQEWHFGKNTSKIQLRHWTKLCGGSVLQLQALASSKVCGKSRSGRAFGPAWIRWIVCVYAQHLRQGSAGPHGELFFLSDSEGAGDSAGQ